LSGGKRLYIAAQITLALIAAPQTGAQPVRAALPDSVGRAVDIIQDEYDNFDDTISAPYDNSRNTPPAQPESPNTDALNVKAPRSQEELGEMSREELYRLAFGKAAPERPRSLVMRLFVEGQAFGNTEIVYDADFASFDFDSPQFSSYLDTLLLPDARGAAGDSTGYFNSAVLTAAGYVVSANELMYEMHITVPPEGKVLQRMSLGGGYARPPAGLEVKPSAVSFYMNYRADERLTWSRYYNYDSDYKGYRYDKVDGSRDPVDVDFDGALNVFGWTLESSARLREPYEGQEFTWENFRRGDVRLVRDIVSWRTRVTAGDVDMSSDLLSYGETVGGLRWEYNDWFFGGEPTSARSRVTFFMPRAGEVELFMDGRFQQRFYLPAGRHEISGFGGNIGRNRVRLVLRMDDGSVEEVPYEFVLGDPRNMLRGESRYTVTAGIRRDYAPSPACYEYQVEEPAAGADILYGLLPSLSAGAAAQGSRVNALAAMQFLWNMGAPGWMNARAYGSRGLENRRTGGRADLNYTADLGSMVKALDNRFFGGNGRMPNMSLSIRGDYRSEYYNENLFSESSVNPYMAGVSGDFGFGIYRGSMSTSGGAVFNRETPDAVNYSPVDYNYGLRVSQSVNRATFSVNAGARVRDGVHKPYLSAYTNYSLGVRVGRHQFSASGDISMRSDYVEASAKRVWDSTAGAYEYEEVDAHNDYRMTGGANAGWRWSNGSTGIGAQSYSATVSMRDRFGIPSVGASANSSFNRAQLWLDYGMMNYETAGYDRMTHTARATLAGSFMFADGLWALGRPTNGSFLLADTRYNLKNASAHINRSNLNRRDYSRSGWFGAAYQNYLMSYRPTEVTVSLSDVPPGALVESNIYYANGAYKRGYALRLGSRQQVIALVRLTDNGEPLRYVYASIEPDDEWSNDSEKRATFTGGDGVLQIGGLVPGASYRIKFGASTYIKDIVIEIPGDADPITELPDIEVERE